MAGIFTAQGLRLQVGLLVGVSYRAATNFSFLIAIPMMLAASGYEMLKSYKLLTAPGDAAFFITGFLIAFIVALLSRINIFEAA